MHKYLHSDTPPGSSYGVRTPTASEGEQPQAATTPATAPSSNEKHIYIHHTTGDSKKRSQQLTEIIDGKPHTTNLKSIESRYKYGVGYILLDVNVVEALTGSDGSEGWSITLKDSPDDNNPWVLNSKSKRFLDSSGSMFLLIE